MKLFLYLFTFFTFAVQAQESKLRFWDHLNVELNANLSRTSYLYLSTNTELSSHNYIPKKSLWGTADIGLHFRNQYFNTGVNLHTINNYYYQFSLGGNAFFASKKISAYLGPFVSFGEQFNKNDLYFNRYVGIGIEYYIKTIHTSLSYQFFNAHNAMRGLNFQFGTSVPLFRNKNIQKNRFLKDFYVEGNAGMGVVNYSKYDNYTATGGYTTETFKQIIPKLDFSLNYRTKKLKIGASYSLLHSVGPIFGLNFISPDLNFYFGPFVSLSYFLGNHAFYDSKQYTECGMETYVKNIHFALSYSMYTYSSTDNSPYSHIKGFSFKLGYAIPFSTDKKKKNQ